MLSSELSVISPSIKSSFTFFLLNLEEIAPIKIFLVIGIIRRKPKISVKNPGMIRSKAAKAKAAPEIISYIGISFFINWLKPDLIVFKPSNLAKKIPVIAVKKN